MSHMFENHMLVAALVVQAQHEDSTCFYNKRVVAVASRQRYNINSPLSTKPQNVKFQI